ncbi:hypothetical protein K2Z84_04695 [Candidatus Binatia bacterium]|jgi:hypothetical protein|nr:hypothetical protein [Candidatus Binatia bacterium]
MSVAPASAVTDERRLTRNDIVRLFGTPSETIGSVNEPRQQHEAGFQYNERWIYDRPKNEPSRPKARVIYWQRYDFVASERIERDGHRVPESPAELLARLG